MAKLNKKQQIFVAEYLIDQNATRSYIAAGYSTKGAAQSAERLLRKAEIAAEISHKHGKRLEKLEISADRVLQELAKLAFFDPRKLFNSDGSPKQILELDDDTAASVAGLEVNELFEGEGDQKHAYGLTKKIKIADKGQNLERLGRHLKLFTDKAELSGKDGAPIEAAITVQFVKSHAHGG